MKLKRKPKNCWVVGNQNQIQVDDVKHGRRRQRRIPWSKRRKKLKT